MGEGEAPPVRIVPPVIALAAFRKQSPFFTTSVSTVIAAPDLEQRCTRALSVIASTVVALEMVTV